MERERRAGLERGIRTGERPRNKEWLRVALQAAEFMERGEINKPNHRGNTALMTAASHAYP